LASPRLQPIGAPGDLIAGIEFGKGQARQLGQKGRPKGGVVGTVDAGSPAHFSGIEPGDGVLSVNGRKLRDVIDLQFFTAGEPLVHLEGAPQGDPHGIRDVAVRQSLDQHLGISFTEPTFSPIRECNNHCPFCFIDQLPGSMRSSLYIRDDDYRYSFLFGNFVTLTNLNERDWERLAEQRLSPLYVSIHATDPKMRKILLGNERIPNIMDQLERLFALVGELPDVWDVMVGFWPDDSRTSRFTHEAWTEEHFRGLPQLTSKPVVGIGWLT